MPKRPPHFSRPRFFFALPVPAAVAAPLSDAQTVLRGNWRPVRPEQLHLTLLYLPADLKHLPDLKALGSRLASQTQALNLQLRGTGFFPNEGSPRVWFVRAQAAGLEELAAQLRAGVGEFGLSADEQFRAHVTLARKKGPAPRPAPLRFDLGWTAAELLLYRSHLQKTGPIHEVLARFPFAPPAAEITSIDE